MAALPTILLFDAAGVLFETNLAVGEALTRELGIAPEQQGPIWNELRALVSTGQISDDEYFAKLSEFYGIAPDKIKAVFESSFTAAFQPMPGMAELLKKLQAAGRRLVVLSDTAPVFDRIRTDFATYAPFEKVFVSYEIGFTKPDPAAFRAVLDFYDLPPEAFFFIDDQTSNVDAARNLGMEAVVFTSTAQLESDLRKAKLL